MNKTKNMRTLEGKIDLVPWFGGDLYDSELWFNYANKHNKIMVSAADIYNAGKSKNKELIKSLRKDFDSERELLTSTVIVNDLDDGDLDLKIVHYFGSEIVNPITMPKCKGPDKATDNHPNEPFLLDVLNSQDGLKYLQTIFNTNDSKEEIVDTLYKLSSKKPKDIIIELPHRERAICFSDDGFFRIKTLYISDDYGIATRGIK